MQQKAATPDKFSKKQQSRLEEVTEGIVDLEEQIENAPVEVTKEVVKKTAAKYIPPKGTERMVHLSIVRGQRFDGDTGKELTKPYVQMFTYGEYKNFKKQAALIGYKVVEVLYNPYKD